MAERARTASCCSQWPLSGTRSSSARPAGIASRTISLAFGPMGSQVVSLEVVLPDGRLLTTRPVPKYSSGPNLNQLFIGSEGAFGVITKATIRVFRQPEAQVFATMGFDTCA